ncbi:hypothetical protein BH23ACT5_BH23ACT5_02130 [soil metagenome]
MNHLRPLLVTVMLASALAIGPVAPPVEAGYAVVSESWGCGWPRFSTPLAATTGPFPSSLPVRGPAGALFGRTIGEVESQLVWWSVPMSDGARVRVHRRLLPALREVEQNLAEAAAQGRDYRIRSAATYGYSPRTSIAHSGISYHGLGAAIDINTDRNPYRRDGVLVTDMPAWFVEAWESAGFCWGGNWLGVKDAMHFSWAGPAATPGFESVPDPYRPRTSRTAFDTTVGAHAVVFGPGDSPRFVKEASGDGAPDVLHVRPWDDHAVLEVATARGGYADCSVWRYWLDDPPAGTPELADLNGVGRPDLVYPDDSGPTLLLRPYSALEGYERANDIATTVEVREGRRFTFGDANGDGADDLWALDPHPDGSAVEIFSAASGFTDSLGAGVNPTVLTAATILSTGDRLADGRAELLVTNGDPASSVTSVVTASSLAAVAEAVVGPGLSPGDVLGHGDYDGDGHTDLQVLGSDGTLSVWRGNTALAGVAPASWFLPSDFDCPDDTIPYHHQGRFADDDDSEFQADIEWLAERGITRGCNPPFQDRFCPGDPVSRGEMAAFLSRALGIAGGEAAFVDSAGSVFEPDIGALATAGITRGCNPPDNDMFCPHDPVTRGQMAAFLNRAFGLPPGPNDFVDDDGSVFEEDIGALAAAGITRGCNPPQNDRFCADQSVTRGQMAAFLNRGKDLLGDG